MPAREGAKNLETAWKTVSEISDAWIVAGLLVVFLTAGTLSLVGDSATFDETAHLPSGYTYLDRGDFRMNPEHPPLSKAWSALPLHAFGLARADYRSPNWRGVSIEGEGAHRSKANQWVFGYEFLNGPRGDVRRAEPMRLLIPARLMTLVLGVALGLLVYAWARELWGRRGGLVSLFLFCLSPTMLAHARLVTTDLPIALGFTATLYAFWRFQRAPSVAGACIVGVALAGALLIKFSALLLGPILVLLGASSLLAPAETTQTQDARPRSIRLRHLAGAALATCLIAYAGVWAGYGFRYAAAADTDPDYQLDWEIFSRSEGPAYDTLDTAIQRQLLPEAYLYGLAFTLRGTQWRSAFLNGEESNVGWWYYFPEAFLIKTPPAILLAIAWGVWLLSRQRRIPPRNAWFLLISIAVYGGVLMAGGLNIGHRHLTPIYPLLFVLIGALARPIPGPPWQRWVLPVLLCGHLLSFVAATPGYLSYFNQLAGGPEGGRRYLLDSNVDWGQDLDRLSDWMRDRNLSKIHLAYFGTADPEAYGIRFEKVFLHLDLRPEKPSNLPRSGDFVAVSVNLLGGLYLKKDQRLIEELVRRKWIDRPRVARWITLRDGQIATGQRVPELERWLVDEGVIDAAQLETARSGLLSTWLQRLDREVPVVGLAGDSIRIFQLP